MYDLQTRSSRQVQQVLQNNRITRRLLWWLQTEWVGIATVIKIHFQNGDTTCHQLFKTLPDNSTIFLAEATAITLALNYYRHMVPVQHDVVVYSGLMSHLQTIGDEDTDYPFICHIMNLLCLLSNKHTCLGLLSGHQAIVALRENWKTWPASKRHWTMTQIHWQVSVKQIWSHQSTTICRIWFKSMNVQTFNTLHLNQFWTDAVLYLN